MTAYYLPETLTVCLCILCMNGVVYCTDNELVLELVLWSLFLCFDSLVSFTIRTKAGQKFGANYL